MRRFEMKCKICGSNECELIVDGFSKFDKVLYVLCNNCTITERLHQWREENNE